MFGGIRQAELLYNVKLSSKVAAVKNSMLQKLVCLKLMWVVAWVELLFQQPVTKCCSCHTRYGADGDSKVPGVGILQG